MKLFDRFVYKNLSLNKKRTVVTIIGIMLSVALLTAVSGMYSSLIGSLKNFEKYEKGSYHLSLFNIDEKKYDELKGNKSIKDIHLIKEVGYTYLDEIKDNSDYILVSAYTTDSLNNMAVHIMEGRLPENEHELIITSDSIYRGGVLYKVGDTVTYNLGKRVCNEEYLYKNDSYCDGEKLENEKEVTYTIVGIADALPYELDIDDGFTFITHLDKIDFDGTSAYIEFTNKGAKKYIKTISNLLGINYNTIRKYLKNEYISVAEANEVYRAIENLDNKFDVNMYLLMLESSPLDDVMFKGLGFCVIVVSIVIILSSVFCIKNSFDISISEKTKQFGILRSIGATKKQIRSIVFKESAFLGLIGIPLGILLGLLATLILCLIVNGFLHDMVTTGFKMCFSVNLYVIILSVVLGIVTINLSSLKGARRASKVSPIDSIRNSGDVKIKRLKSNKLIGHIFGIGGDISYKNLKRNRKKYRTTIISIIISVIIFVVLTYFISSLYKSVIDLINVYDYNFTYSIGDIEDERLNQSLKLPGIKNYSIVRETDYQVNNPVLNEDSSKYAGTNDYTFNNIMVVSLGDYQYKKYLHKLGLSFDEYKDKAILIDNHEYKEYINNKEITTYYSIFDYKKHDYIELENWNGNNKKIEYGKTVTVLPFGIYDSYYTYAVVSDDVLTSIDNLVSAEVYIDAKDPYELQESMEKIFDGEDIYFSNLKEEVQTVKNLILLLSIFLYGFVLVVSLIGVTNIINTISTSMELRKQEFAMLKSVGMTKIEFARMILLESAFMCSKALLIALPISTFICYRMYKKFIDKNNFIIPVMPILISVLAVVLLITLIMWLSIKKINKQNTVETIRNENI